MSDRNPLAFLAGTALLTVAVLPWAAHARQATTRSPAATERDDAAFEAALRALPTPAPTAATPRPSAATPERRRSSRAEPAAAGTLPARWQAPPRNADQLDEAARAADHGEIDPVAWIERHAGKVPLLPGARPFRCETASLRASYTFGIDGAPGARAAIAGLVEEEQREAARQAAARAAGTRARGHGLPGAWLGHHLDAHKVPVVAAKLREMEALLRAQGYRRWGNVMEGQWRPATLREGDLFLDIMLSASSIMATKQCLGRGIAIPTGPIFYVTPRIYQAALFG